MLLVLTKGGAKAVLRCPGCASGEIYLWQFGAPQAMAGYTPLPATAGTAPPPASGSIFSSPKSMWAIDRPGALAALGNWGQPQSVSLSLRSPTKCSRTAILHHMKTLPALSAANKPHPGYKKALGSYLMDTSLIRGGTSVRLLSLTERHPLVLYRR